MRALTRPVLIGLWLGAVAVFAFSDVLGEYELAILWTAVCLPMTFISRDALRRECCCIRRLLRRNKAEAI